MFSDIEETLDVKRAALKKHASQFREWDPGPFFRKTAERQGRAGGVSYTESFRVIRFDRPLT